MGSSNAVDQPIVNDAFLEPTRYWAFDEGIPELRQGRRPAGYLLAPRTRDTVGPRAAEASVDLPLVNKIRSRVKSWRVNGYPGATRMTRILLEYWRREDRRKLFFCQLEAAETIIWLTESPASERQGIEVPLTCPRTIRVWRRNMDL